jgi:hypothetical protein
VSSDLLTPIPDNKTGWLFVLNQVSPDPSGNNGAGWAMQATFDLGGTVDGTIVQTNSNTIKWAVYSPLGAKLQSAVAFGPVGASAGVLTVSHCANGAEATTTSSSASSPSAVTGIVGGSRPPLERWGRADFGHGGTRVCPRVE